MSEKTVETPHTCGMCRHFHGNEHDGAILDGECRRHPPHVSQYEVYENGAWPKFASDHDACGDFEP